MRTDAQLEILKGYIQANNYQQLMEIVDIKTVGISGVLQYENNIINENLILMIMESPYTTNAQKNMAEDFAGKNNFDKKDFDGYWASNYSINTYSQ